MKLGRLTSVAHNISDSLASGVGIMIGFYELPDVFAEASASEPGFIEVDFLAGSTAGSPASVELHRVVGLYAAALSGHCKKHGVPVESFRVLRARFGTDQVCGCHFTVTVEDERGRRSEDRYIGSPGRRFSQLQPTGSRFET